jgi:hypothetical protein
MSVRAVIISVSCPAIHAVACRRSNPKILGWNDKSVMPPHFGAAVMFSQRRRVETDANDLLSTSRCGVASKKILTGLHLRILPNGGLAAKRISALPHACFISALPGRKILFLLFANRPDGTGLHQGERPS